MKRGYLYIGATAFLFSTAEIVSKLLADRIHPFQLVFLRFLIGGLVLLPFALADIRRRGLRLGMGDIGFFLLTGFLGVTVAMSLFQLALMVASASMVAVVFSVNTVFTALFAVLILRERFSVQAGLAIVLGLAGVVCMLNPFAAKPDFLGVGLSLLSAVLFALYGVVSTKRVARCGGFVLNCFSFLAGVLMMLPVLLLSSVPLFGGIDGSTVLPLLYSGVFVTGLGYVCYLQAMRETSAIETSAAFFIKPALAPLLAMLVLGDAVGVNMGLGIAFIAAGAFVMFRKRLLAKTAK